MSRRRGLAPLAVLLFALLALALGVLPHPVYTPDGIVYARSAARDAGQSERDATMSARAFYERTPLAALPRYRDLIEIDPSVAFERSRIFANRLLYPALAALLFPLLGIKSLFAVSAVAYVAFAAVLYWLLASFGRPWSAAIICIVVLALPITRGLAASDLTDMLAAVFWTLALGALLRSMLNGRSQALIVTIAFASVLLVLTRPTPYLVLLPALAAGFLRGLWLEFAASCAAVVVYAPVGAFTRAFDARSQLQWVYLHETGAARQPFGRWYQASFVRALHAALSGAVRSVVPALALAAAIAAIVRGFMRDEMIVLLAAGLACLLAIPLNPVADSLGRVVGFPLLPPMAAVVAALVSALPLRQDRPLN